MGFRSFFRVEEGQEHSQSCSSQSKCFERFFQHLLILGKHGELIAKQRICKNGILSSSLAFTDYAGLYQPHYAPEQVKQAFPSTLEPLTLGFEIIWIYTIAFIYLQTKGCIEEFINISPFFQTFSYFRSRTTNVTNKINASIDTKYWDTPTRSTRSWTDEVISAMTWSSFLNYSVDIPVNPGGHCLWKTWVKLSR